MEQKDKLSYQGIVMLRSYFPYLALVLYFAAMPIVGAAGKPGNAYEVVRSASDRIMGIVESAADYAEKDPERYDRELLSVLDEVVDFSGFARGVMGPYASKSYYKSLSAEEKAVLRAQVKRFTKEIRIGLVRTYGKGLLVFGGSKVEVQRPNDEAEDPNKSSIVQLIYSDAPEPYVIQYQMRRSKKDGIWRLRNLIVEDINLGGVYRAQFQAAARDSDGNLDAVIDNWITTEEEG
jgi:phospholipid transport system substrate-binding protein